MQCNATQRNKLQMTAVTPHLQPTDKRATDQVYVIGMGRMGARICPHPLHLLSILHPFLEDWLVANRYMG